MSISAISSVWPGGCLERLKDLVDDETLERRYLFPASPWDEPVLEQTLLAQIVGHSQKVPSNLDLQVSNVGLELSGALLSIDEKRSSAHPEVKLNLNSFEFLLVMLIHLQTPLFRLDGRKVFLQDEGLFRNKYIMVCSLPLPDSWDSSARDLAIQSNELYTQRPHDFELIILATFRRDDGNTLDKFVNGSRFFEPFHPNCIVIPVDGDIQELRGLKNYQLLLIGPKGNVLLQKDVSIISNFGSVAFPFTNTSNLRDEYWSLYPSSLAWFLGFKPSHKVFRLLPGTEPLLEECRCISEFQSKIVLLYLYCLGDQLAFLYKTVISLREKGIEFEILTAYVNPCAKHHPLQFIKVFSSLVAQRGLSWWVVPFDSSTYPRLRPRYAKHKDRLVVFDPKLEYGDPHGFKVMSLYGESMFPFTRMSVVEHVMKELSQVTLLSLFEPISDICKGGRHVKSMGEVNTVLKGKNVLVYFHSFWSNPAPVYDPFVSWYLSLEEDEICDFEVVYVCLNLPQVDNDFSLQFPFPIWSVFPDDEKVHSKYVVDNFFLKLFKHEFSTIVAFGKDGKIRSLRAHGLMSSSKANNVGSFSFDGNLPGEVFNIFTDYCKEKRVVWPAV